MGPLGLSIFHHCTKFGAKMLIDAEITGQNRNPRWRPSAILDFRKPDFWALHPLGLPILHLRTKFGAKMLIDAEIMAQNRNSRWRPSAILDFRKSDFWELEPLGLPIFHLDTKFGAKMLTDAEIMLKKSKKRKKGEERNLQWQTGCSPRPPTLTQRCVVLHAGWSSGGSYKFQVSSKPFSRCGGSKIAISYT